MEIFGGFMVMMSIISLFLAVVWLIMPFVVFAIKGKQDRTLEVLETIEKRLAVIESRLAPVVETEREHTDVTGQNDSSAESSLETVEKTDEAAVIHKESEASPAVPVHGGL